MYAAKRLVSIVERFLPVGAEILTFGEYYDAICIGAKDIDHDQQREIVALYKNQDVYLIIVKKENNEWVDCVHYMLPYTEVVYFNLLAIKNSGKYEMVIGGKVDELARYQLDCYEYREDDIHAFISNQIEFDKIDIQNTPQKVHIIVWEHIKKEAYSVKVYCWNGESIVRDDQGGAEYLKSVCRYYKHLKNKYPDETIYKECLDNLYRQLERGEKTSHKDKNKNTEIKTEVERKTEIKIKTEVKRKTEVKQQLLEVIPIVIGHQRGELFILGNTNEEGIEGFTMYVNTLDNHQLLHRESKLVTDYKVFVGSFRENGEDEIILTVGYPCYKQSIAYVYGWHGHGMRQYFNTYDSQVKNEEDANSLIIQWHQAYELYGLACREKDRVYDLVFDKDEITLVYAHTIVYEE